MSDSTGDTSSTHRVVRPELWFVLYELAARGAIHRKCSITTSELGSLLGVSQQTASKRLLHCETEGLITRAHSAAGMSIQLTEKGQRELQRVLRGLEIAFTPTRQDVVIEGVVVSGIGEGAYYVEVYSSRFEKALGFRPFPGTLNVRATDKEARAQIQMMKAMPPLVVAGFTHEGRTFGDVVCYRVKINDTVDGAVVVAQRTHHGEDILEIIAPVKLRDHLDLKDRSPLKLTVIPLHCAA
ncbi:MAG: DUF120 domain-containing protein [Candidatus Thorarchaeota archaeon]